jgi:aldose 1-epimerase
MYYVKKRLLSSQLFTTLPLLGTKTLRRLNQLAYAATAMLRSVISVLLILLCGGCMGTLNDSTASLDETRTCTIERQPFGTLSSGEKVEEFTLSNAHGVHVRIITWGGIIREIMTPDREGKSADIVLGYDSLAPYEARHPYFGTLTGRFANRIARGTFELDGQKYTLARNNGVNHLHGGINGFDRKIWTAIPSLTADSASLELELVSPDGDEGYPGTVSTKVIYTLNSKNELRVDYFATTTEATPLNLTSHSYFNLAGHNSGSVLAQHVQLFADSYLPVDETLIPTGVCAPVKGSPFDFSTPQPIGARIADVGLGYDHNFIVSGTPGKLRPVARVWDPSSGRTLEVTSTQPGVQFYTGNHLERERGKAGALYGKHAGFCLETQSFPDSVNQPSFPSAIVRPGEVYKHSTVFTFGVQRQ